MRLNVMIMVSGPAVRNHEVRDNLPVLISVNEILSFQPVSSPNPNLTADGVQTYGWDGDNNLVQADTNTVNLCAWAHS
jgi:hypothetical protein